MDPTLEAIISIWQPAAERPLGEADAREITGNLIGFFETLARWDAEDAAAATTPASLKGSA